MVGTSTAHGFVHSAIQAFLMKEVLLLHHFYQTLTILEIKSLTLQGVELRSEHLKPLA